VPFFSERLRRKYKMIGHFGQHDLRYFFLRRFVRFLVAGFHQIVIYKPDKTDDDVILGSGPLFINDTIDQSYLGIEPAEGPLAHWLRSIRRTREIE
jgi:hypothetical protein